MKSQVSVVMAVHNEAQFCREAIQSVLSQTFREFEFIIVDDGSTDTTHDILKEIATSDSRVRVLTQKNQGAAASRNRGIELATGSIIASMDGDDRSLPHRLQVLLEVLESNQEVGLAGGNCEVIDEHGRIVGYRIINSDNVGEALLKRCVFQGGDVVFRKELWKAVGGYRQAFRFAQDYDLWLRMSEKSKAIKVPEVTFQWRVGARSPTLTKMIQHDGFADMARRFALERRSQGSDSYELRSKELLDLAKQDKSDREYAALWVGLMKLRDLGKSRAIRELSEIVCSEGKLRWRIAAKFALVCPERIMRILLKF